MSMLPALINEGGEALSKAGGSALSKLIKKSANKILNNNSLALKSILKGTSGFTKNNNIDLRHTTSNKNLSGTDLSVFRPSYSDQTHQGVLYTSPKYSQGVYSSNTGNNKIFGSLKNGNVIDLSKKDTAEAFANIYQKYLNSIKGYNSGLSELELNDIRNGITESLHNRNGKVKIPKNTIIKGKSALGEDEYIFLDDKTLKKAFRKNLDK